MLKRKIYNDLLEWKSRKHKCLLISGQRQTGKTFIVRKFAENEYENLVEINFSKNKEYEEIFQNNLEPKTIVDKLSLKIGTKINPENTLIFFDEIQECPEAWTSLKFFTEDGKYDVIASGSLLGITLPQRKKNKPEPLVPMGYQETLTLRSLDFEEFLWAMGIDAKTIEDVKTKIEKCSKIDDFVLNEFEKLFRTFMITGGMPESVQKYVDTKMISESVKIKENIISICRDDIIRYNYGVDKSKTLECFEAIPSNLSKSNRKFMYSTIDGNGSRSSSEKYKNNILWIKNAGVGNFCYALTQLSLPLKQNEKRDAFRVYMSDTGLLLQMYGKDSVDALANGNTEYNFGAVTENVVFESLVKSGIVPYFYRKNSGTDKMELDFVVETEGKLAIIEVKSGRNRDSPSLDKAAKLYNPERKIVFGKNNCERKKGKEFYPLFASAFASLLF